ncbi:L-threonine 3-dehydrogenase [Candidatus Parvarchaeota archaeon]|nr:L-threonine 3-dehydrogenase [Candidatus Parvarchaeota archaeon]
MAKMQALQKPTSAPGAKLVDAEIPKIGPNEALVEIKATSICGTDIHIYKWDKWASGRIKTPLIFGHEFSGEVIEVGKNVSSVKMGDCVSGETHIYCGSCFQCTSGNAHVCENVKLRGIDVQGCFSQFHAAPANTLWVNDKSIPHELASAQEPLGNAVHTVFDGEVAGQIVLVYGCGPIGVCAAALCRQAGAAMTIAVDRLERKLKMAKSFGADVVLDNSKVDVVKEIKDITNGHGVDVFLEMSGAPVAFKHGFSLLRPEGRASLLGIPSEPVSFNMAEDIVFRSARIHGINGRRIWETWHKSAAFLKTGKIDLAKLVTHKFGMTQYEKAFEVMASGESGKVVMFPGK